jgi:hypothetical protein
MCEGFVYPPNFATTAFKDAAPTSLARSAFIRTNASLLGPRLRRHKTCEAVVHNELAVVFTAMLWEMRMPAGR